jgi:chromate transporter
VNSEKAIRPTQNKSGFLRDVFVCSLGAFGGPEAHISVFLDVLVIKRRYLSEEDLIELVALCSILPGPTSSQTIVAVGYREGGPLLALLTMIVWALPAVVIMGALSFLGHLLGFLHVSTEVLRFIGPMAVGFIVLAAFRISKKVVIDRLTAVIMVIATIITLFIRDPWVFPLVLVLGGFVSVIASREKQLFTKISVQPPWFYLVVFALLAVFLLAATLAFDEKLVHLAESFYRYGYLVFGGGQVVVPVMYSELVEVQSYMTDREFLTGYGLVQGLPGPMFSFAAYAGGMAARGSSWPVQVIGAILGGIGIFLPGLLLIYFVFPFWTQLKQLKAVRIALQGIGAVAGGMIVAAAVILLRTSGFTLVNLAVTVFSILLLASRRVPAPLIVLLALGAGFLSTFA